MCVPKNVREAYEIDKATGIDFWTKAIEREMSNVRIAFEKLKDVSVEQMKSGKIKPLILRWIVNLLEWQG